MPMMIGSPDIDDGLIPAFIPIVVADNIICKIGGLTTAPDKDRFPVLHKIILGGKPQGPLRLACHMVFPQTINDIFKSLVLSDVTFIHTLIKRNAHGLTIRTDFLVEFFDTIVRKFLGQEGLITKGGRNL